MSLDTDILEFIKEGKMNNMRHVFFINNPVTSIISKLIIEKYLIDTENILIISIRNSDTSLLNYTTYKLNKGSYDPYLEKFFWYSPSNKKISNFIGCDNFILYASWAYREVVNTLNNKFCKGHFYIEEGQHSYMDIKPYNPKKITLLDKLKINWKNRFSKTDSKGYYFRDDAFGFFALSSDAYPGVKKQQKIILDNLIELKKTYEPKLQGIKHIGITCASRRLKQNEWKTMIKKLMNKMINGGIIKLHPSFLSSNSRNRMIKIFNEINNPKFVLSDDNVIIELEMLYEKKILYGHQTSLSKYAEILNSKFIRLKLYNEN
mgnify:CR=1 FL=1